MIKDVGIRIRVDRILRDRFLKICRAQDRPAAQVLREFMRSYVEQNVDRPHTDKAERRQRPQRAL
jgi:hypothetical protein